MDEVKRPPVLIPHLALLVVTSVYGASYFISKAVFEAVHPFALVVIRSVSVTIMMWLLASWRAPKESIQNKADWGRLVLCGLSGASINQLLFYLGLSFTFQVNASILMTFSPIFVFITAFFLKTERLTGRKILGLVLAGIGAVLISLNGRRPELGMETVLGDVLVLINAASYGVYLVLVQPLLRRYHLLTVIKWVFLFGAVNNLIWGLPSFLEIEWGSLGPDILGGIAFVVLGATFLVFLLNSWALQYVPASAVSIYIYLQPVIVAIAAEFLKIERLTTTKLLLIGLVIIGVYVATYRKKKPQTIRNSA
ncbi:MAG: DMT family transporter [Bacteroidota bacterium]